MEMKDRKKAEDTAESRMQMIAPLLAPELDASAATELKIQISEKHGVSVRSLERYLKSYEEEGFAGLQPQGKGTPQKYKIPADVLDEAIRLKRELPSRSIPTIIHILELEHRVDKGFLKRTTLQDALARVGFSSSQMKVYQDKGYASQRFQRVHRMDLWQGDIKYGPILNIKGVITRTYLSCLIDDATRYIIHAEFYPTQESEIVEDTLKKAVLKYGTPRRIYFDNGKQYRNRWMKRACGLLGIKLIYAKPRNPQGKGKQERFNLTIDSFMAEVGLNPPDSIEELNRLLQGWLSECYHSQQHSALGTTPEIAFRTDSMPFNFPDSAICARAFLHCEQRKADKSGVISFRSQRYDLGVKYAGRNVDVVFEPANDDTITIEFPGELPFQVHKLVVGEHVARRAKRKNVAKIPVDHSRLLDAVAGGQGQKEERRARAISYTAEVQKG